MEDSMASVEQNGDVLETGNEHDPSWKLSIGDQSTSSNVTEPDGGQSTCSNVTEPDGGQSTNSNVTEPDGGQSTSSNVTEPDGGQSTSSNVTEPDGSQSTSSNVTEPDGGQSTSSNVTEPDGGQSTSSNVTEPDGGQSISSNVTEPNVGQSTIPNGTESTANSGWELADNHSVLGPGPTPEVKVAEGIPTGGKEYHAYFMIRIPKPVDNKGKTEIRMAELRLKEKTEKRDFINAASQMKWASRHEALNKLRAAREKVRGCGDAIRQKREEVEPLQGSLRKLRDTGRLARDKSRDLPASEQELDERIAYFEYRIQHESIPLKEEKQLLREIKNLKASREEVCANEALHAEFSESLGEREDIQGRLKPLISELEALRAEWTIATDKAKAAEAEFEQMDKALKQVQDQWAVANQARQRAYDERATLIRQENARNDEFYQNRREIQHVKQFAFKKDQKMVEELSNAQVERVMSSWNSNAEFRAAYVKSNEKSTLKRLQTFDGRALGPDEEPPLISVDGDDDPLGTQIEAGPLVTRQHSQREGPVEPSHTPGSLTSDNQRKVPDASLLSESNGYLPSGKAGLDALSSSQDESGKEDLAAAAKLKEQRREQEMAKAREAEVRKRRSAERLQSKALARAQKEAERREKEKEKKAHKKAAGLSSLQGISSVGEVGGGEPQEAEPGSSLVQEVPSESKSSVRQRGGRQHSQKTKSMKAPIASSLSKRDGTHLPTWFWMVAALIGLLIFLAFLPRFVL